MKRSDIVGLHRIKNKVSRNAFDLSHRHMFTAKIGELLPIFSTWVNPNDTLKLSYSGFSRTAPLQTAAFTRLKENVQYYFVPFQSLWKYFEQTVNNMTEGQSGENISKFAKDISSPDTLGTKLPYISYSKLSYIAMDILTHTVDRLLEIWKISATSIDDRTNYNYLLEHLNTADRRFQVNGVLRYSSAFKLLSYLGYGNFPLMSYDVISSWISFLNKNNLPAWSTSLKQKFLDSEFGYHYYPDNAINTPNLSILPLLAYHKIINDHYRYKQWQPFEPWTCNIDYVTPSSSMDFGSRLSNSNYMGLNNTFFDIEFSNLPLDYFNGVLPRAQYGDESSAIVNNPSLSGTCTFSGPTSQGVYSDAPSTAIDHLGHLATNINLATDRSGVVTAQGVSENPLVLRTQHTHSLNNVSGGISIPSSEGSLRISALRSAIALQKYKEVQNSNDSDFAEQVLAHFGIKPKSDSRTSRFIGGSDSVIDINPQINQNLSGGNQADIKATATGKLSAGCKFTADTYGIVIGIYRCVPQLDFAHVGIDRQLLKTDSTDFVIPELDSIGMQTQYRFEVSAPRVGVLRKDLTPYDDMMKVDMSLTYGYAPRYSEYKVSYDRVDGAFNSVLSSWVTGYDTSRLSLWNYPTSTNTPQGSVLDLLTCLPSICNPIFEEQINGCVANDKIFVGSVNTCVAIRALSVHGLPYTN